MMRRLVLALGALLAFGQGALAAEGAPTPPHQRWSFSGMTGTFDRAALQRGFQVYKDVCASCHGMRQLSYRHLTGIGLTLDQVRAIVAEIEVPGLNDSGETINRAARPSDRFRAPFANEAAARAANSGAYPPDLSVITKARVHGPDYLFALLIGYGNAPSTMQMMEGMHYNQYFAGGQIAMAPPLAEARPAGYYTDGTNATVEQMARDVTAFLAWAAEPELEARRALGWRALIFLLLLSVALYVIKKRVWSDIH
jgi:ubiquinol-cytochrome c reductase cytochrome c1 subunit